MSSLGLVQRSNTLSDAMLRSHTLALYHNKAVLLRQGALICVHSCVDNAHHLTNAGQPAKWAETNTKPE